MDEGWVAEITVDCADEGAARRLHRVLGPESSREVPRARARLPSPRHGRLSIEIEARDTGALRAALQTFLGWVQLEAETTRSGSTAPGSRSEP